MGKRKRTFFGDSVVERLEQYDYYYNKIKELSLSLYNWINLPSEIDERFLELTLFERGSVVFTYDDALERYICLPGAWMGKYNIYRIPILRRLIASNGYNYKCDIDNSVIIFNNNLRLPSDRETRIYAKRIANIDLTIDVNVTAQKTPILIRCKESQRLTLANLYQQYVGDQPVIFGSDDLDLNSFSVLKTEAPYVSDKLYELKSKYWNEVLTMKGISSVLVEKPERLTKDEVLRSLGGTYANRYPGLVARQRACNEINKMFNLNVSCEFREDIPEEYNIMDDSEGGETVE